MSSEREQVAELAGIYLDTLNSGHGIIARFEQGNRAAEAILAAGYSKSSVTSELESLADFFDEMASLASYSQSEAVMETWLEAAKYARSRVTA